VRHRRGVSCYGLAKICGAQARDISAFVKGVAETLALAYGEIGDNADACRSVTPATIGRSTRWPLTVSSSPHHELITKHEYKSPPSALNDSSRPCAWLSELSPAARNVPARQRPHRPLMITGRRCGSASWHSVTIATEWVYISGGPRRPSAGSHDPRSLRRESGTASAPWRPGMPVAAATCGVHTCLVVSR
jgi:hypothetical protein